MSFLEPQALSLEPEIRMSHFGSEGGSLANFL